MAPTLTHRSFFGSFLLALVVSGSVACSSAEDASSGALTDQSDIVAGKSLVGKWQLAPAQDTDFIVTWWDELELGADGSFAGSEGANVCGDDNCETGTSGDLTGTYTLGHDGDKRTLIFHFDDKRPADRFTFTLSGSTMKMQLSSDKQKGGDFTLTRSK